jgi:thiamine-phosphate pyrophosphorylase
MEKPALFPCLYAIIDAEVLDERGSNFSVIEELADAGVELMQYRDKRASSRILFETCYRLSCTLAGRHAKLILNDRPDLAAVCGAGGVHVGQEDLEVELARSVCGPSLWIGISTHNLAQFKQAQATSADYVAVGPVFGTRSKRNSNAPVGLEFIGTVRQLTEKPVVAIGGVTLENAADVWRAGADSVAVIRDILTAPSPGTRAQEFLDLAKHLRISPG